MPLPGGTSELRSTRPKLVLLLATRCLYQGYTLPKVSLTPKADQMSSWPDVVPLLATRCLYLGVCLSSGQLDPTECHSWPEDASTGGPSDWNAKRTSENLNTLGFWVLHHRGLFYERPTNSTLHSTPILSSWLTLNSYREPGLGQITPIYDINKYQNSTHKNTTVIHSLALKLPHHLMHEAIHIVHAGQQQQAFWCHPMYDSPAAGLLGLSGVSSSSVGLSSSTWGVQHIIWLASLVGGRCTCLSKLRCCLQITTDTVWPISCWHSHSTWYSISFWCIRCHTYPVFCPVLISDTRFQSHIIRWTVCWTDKENLLCTVHFLFDQILFKWLNAADALSNLLMISLSMAPWSLMELPWYVKFSTTSIFLWPMGTSEGVRSLPISIFLVFLLLMDRPSLLQFHQC